MNALDNKSQTESSVTLVRGLHDFKTGQRVRRWR